MKPFLFSFASPDTSSDDLSGVKNFYKGTEHNLTLSDPMINRIVKSDDSEAKGEYHSINTDDWNEIDYHITGEKTLGVGRDYGNNEAIVFVQVKSEGRTDTCEKYILFHKRDWIEYRKERGLNKYKRTKVQKTGIIWVGNTKNIYSFRVFIQKVKT